MVSKTLQHPQWFRNVQFLSLRLQLEVTKRTFQKHGHYYQEIVNSQCISELNTITAEDK